MDDVTTAKNHCEEAEVPQVHNLESRICFSREGLPMLKSTLKSFGSFLTPRTSTWQPNEFNDPQTAKMRKLESANDELDRQLKEMTQKVQDLEIANKVIQKIYPKGHDLKDVFKHFDQEGLAFGSTFRLIKNHRHRSSNGKSALVIKCPKIVLDEDRMNMTSCHLNDNGLMVLGGIYQPANHRGFKTFAGATSTRPLPLSGVMYWEVRAHLGEDDVGVSEGSIAFEIAICNRNHIDLSTTAGPQATVAWRLVYIGSLNTFHVKQYTQASDVPSSSILIKGCLHVGIVFDSDESRWVLLDIQGGQRLSESKSYSIRREAQCPTLYMGKPFKKMAIISGQDLDMNDVKMKLITDVIHNM